MCENLARRIGLSLAVIGLLIAFPVPAPAQTTVRFRVQLHVSADDSIKDAALAALRTAVQPIRDVEIADRDAEYIVSLVILRTLGDSYVASLAVMNVHTERAVQQLAAAWQVGPDTAQRMTAMFKGAGALLDQRILTGPDLTLVCADVATALNTDILAPARRVR